MTDQSLVTEGAAANFEAFLAAVGEKDRSNIMRHLASCEAQDDPGRAEAWKRIASLLASLLGTWSPQAYRSVGQRAIHTVGHRAVQFFVADGRHRMQAFALEDPGDGTLQLYGRDVLDAAVAAGVLAPPVGEEGGARFYPIPGQRGLSLKVETLTAAGTTTAPEFYRNMLGWNRRAVRVTLPAHADAAQVRAVEAFCRLATPPRSAPDAASVPSV